MAAATTLEATASALAERFPDAVSAATHFRGELTVAVKKQALPGVLAWCRDELAFDYLIDVSTIDHADVEPRFEIAYELYSYATGLHLRVKSATTENEPEFPSVVNLWPAANWHEREAYDMMGLKFTGHPDLRRILMWEGYPFFPLRKEFPLAGKPSDMPDVAFTGVAPLAGGPFVTCAGGSDTIAREPRAKGE